MIVGFTTVFRNMGGSPWLLQRMAKVAGGETNTFVFRRNGGGWDAPAWRPVARAEGFRLWIDEVIAAGPVFWVRHELIMEIKNPKR